MRTLWRLWQTATSAGHAWPAFLVEEDEGWREITWAEAAAAVDELATGFVLQGIERGDRVAVLAGTRVEWTLVDYALASIGAVTVPIYPTSSTVECAYIIGNAGARAIVCEDAEQYAKIAPLRAQEVLDVIVTIEGSPGSALRLEDVRASGRAAGDGAKADLAPRAATPSVRTTS